MKGVLFFTFLIGYSIFIDLFLHLMHTKVHINGIYIIIQKVTYMGCLVTEFSICCILYQAGKCLS